MFQSLSRFVNGKSVLLTAVSMVLALTALPASAQEEDEPLEEITVTGSQIKGARISDALAVSIVDAVEIEAMGISSGDELFDSMPEVGQNFFNEAESFSGGVNSVRGDVGTINLRNMGTGNTLVLLNGRRMVNTAGYQTEEVGGAFVPVNSVNSNAIPVYGIERVEVLRDGASAIYGADAVAGVINEVLKKDFEGLTIRARLDDYDNLPRNDQRLNLEWGKNFNGGRTNVGVFFDYYHRDRVNAQDDPRWADQNYSRFVPDEWQAAFGTNYSVNNSFPQMEFELINSAESGRLLDIYGADVDTISSSGRSGLGIRDLTDSDYEFVTYPDGDARCEWTIVPGVICGAPDTSGNFLWNQNSTRDVSSELDRYNLFLYVNHEMENGVESFTELSWYESDSNLNVQAASLSVGSTDLALGPDYYFNPFGSCGSPNRLEFLDDLGFPCSGATLELDNFRSLEAPRISNTENSTYRFLQGFRGTAGDWDWETALVVSKAKRENITGNRMSNSIMQQLLLSSSPDTYNIFAGADGDLEGLRPALVDIFRKDSSDLKMIDLKMTNAELFDMPAGPVGFLAGAEFREESFVDDRDPRLDGTIAFTGYEGFTYPFVSDVANSSPTADNSGSRNVTSLFTEFAVPLLETLDTQLALRYEDFSDVGTTTVGKFAFGWRPIKPLLVRGSWSEAFRAPNLITINEALVVRQNTRDDYVCLYVAEELGIDPDDMPGDCDETTQRRATGSKSLKPEESINTSVGLVWDATENLTFTLDFWSIDKENSIGLFGEENHTKLDLLYRLRAGTSDCDQDFNPAVGRDAAGSNRDNYLDAGVCPAGALDAVDDLYTNLADRIIEGHDIGIYYDKETEFGRFIFKAVATYYDEYQQDGGTGIAKIVDDALKSGELPAWISLRGYGDLLGREGNIDEKINASLRWSKGDWGAFISMLRVGEFYDADTAIEVDGQVVNWVLPSMTTYNASFDYDLEAFGAKTRVRLGVNNFTDERAPICDCRFGYWSDVHRDTGRYAYLDVRMRF